MKIPAFLLRFFRPAPPPAVVVARNAALAAADRAFPIKALTESPPCEVLATTVLFPDEGKVLNLETGALSPSTVARTPRSAAIKAAKKTGFALMSREAHAAASRKGAIASNKKRWAK